MSIIKVLNYFKTRVFIVIVISIIIGVFSWVIHLPIIPIDSSKVPKPFNKLVDAIYGNPGVRYTDITFGLFYKIFDPNLVYDENRLKNLWYNGDKLRMLIYGKKICPIPYIDYKFEYPPIIGLIWYITTCIAFQMGLPSSYEFNNYILYRDSIAQIHFNLQSLILITFFVLLHLYLLKIINDIGYDWRKIFISILLPSTILYLTYNWDIICISFAIMGLYLYMRQRYILSGIFLGLSIATKLLTVAILAIILYELIQSYISRRSLLLFSQLFIITTIIFMGIPYMILLLLTPIGFTDFIVHHATWYCENCIYMLVINDIFNPMNRTLYIAVLTIAMILIFSIPIKERKLLLTCSFLAMVSIVLFNYVFTPQMWLLLTPLAIFIINDAKSLFLYLLGDIANFSIIITFFKDYEIRLWLSKFISIPIEQNPYVILSPVQWIATLRNISLLILWIYILSRTLLENYSLRE